MTNNAQLLSENEATSFAGVSLATLLRYADAGYLHIFKAQRTGSRQFLQSEIAKLFGIELPANNDKNPVEKPNPAQLVAEATAELSNIANSDEAEKDEFPQKAPEIETIELSAQALASRIPSISMDEANYQKAMTLEKETARLQQLVTLQEQLLTIKDRQIEDLGGQIAWLRDRIEKLEDKGHRDQILLLSETQTIRSIISSSQKKSPLRATLEWLGFIQPTQVQEVPDYAIEYKKE